MKETYQVKYNLSVVQGQRYIPGITVLLLYYYRNNTTAVHCVRGTTSQHCDTRRTKRQRGGAPAPMPDCLAYSTCLLLLTVQVQQNSSSAVLMYIRYIVPFLGPAPIFRLFFCREERFFFNSTTSNPLLTPPSASSTAPPQKISSKQQYVTIRRTVIIQREFCCDERATRPIYYCCCCSLSYEYYYYVWYKIPGIIHFLYLAPLTSRLSRLPSPFFCERPREPSRARNLLWWWRGRVRDNKPRDHTPCVKYYLFVPS